MGLRKEIVLKRPRVEPLGSSPPQRQQAKKLANKKIMKKHEEFWLLPKWEVNCQKINEKFSFKALMQNVGLEEYTFHKYALPCNEIVCEFYAHFQLVMGNLHIR